MHTACDDANDRRGVCFFSGRKMASSAHVVLFEGNSGSSLQSKSSGFCLNSRPS